MAWVKTIQGFITKLQPSLPMPNPVYQTSNPICQTASFLCQLCSVLPIGTNLGIVHLLWAILTGRLLTSRGGLFPALADAGFSEKQVRQAGAALREGAFCIQRLLEQQNSLIKRQGQVVQKTRASRSPLYWRILSRTYWLGRVLSSHPQRMFDQAL
jgi:hypothetical protein